MEGIDDFFEEELDLRVDRPAPVDRLDGIESLIEGGVIECAVKKGDVLDVCFHTGREQFHGGQIFGRSDVDGKMIGLEVSGRGRTRTR
ncbi:hypothetical protein MXD59_12400 [Frankia sp. Ag45/Mut15]|uniref:Uncharacterized protein n=1 Tax=Frankia umida TaxID=573489 RepID=A0ABT0JZB9_9ACTN|nr:hypothetical protein [Frankia umida]MCK9876567.1 hypothetical protein [Frankia umida]